MSCLLKENGKITIDPKEILKEQYNFYRNVYTSDPNVSVQYKNHHNIKISAETAEKCEGEISMTELAIALKGMKWGKASGCDGLSMGFYAVFFCSIKQILLDALNYGFKIGGLHNSALRGIINLIPKRNKDSRIIANLRPITLLNTDYKLIKKVLANRLKGALQEIIDEDQKGFLSNRHIATNIRRVFNLIQYAESEDIPTVIISIDFQKCFDTIEIKSLVAGLKYFGFGLEFVRWTEVIYKNATACVINQGNCSPWFNVTRSVKQGGPCSAYYFLVLAEILAIELRNHPGLKGFFVDNLKKILGQFADDMDMYLLGEPNNIKMAFEKVEEFGMNSGFKINYDKTVLYRVGSLKDSDANLYCEKQVQWTNEKN